MAGVLRKQAIETGNQTLFSAQTDSPAYAGFLNFLSSLIIFQNIIPISLYVSIEFVKTFQAFFIWHDLDMYDEQTKKPCVPKTVSFCIVDCIVTFINIYCLS
jgi:phospholipid-translocating ATPase